MQQIELLFRLGVVLGQHLGLRSDPRWGAWSVYQGLASIVQDPLELGDHSAHLPGGSGMICPQRTLELAPAQDRA
jgi:hypothetical protein